MKYNYSICACARWETPYIVEWICYHKALGFDHIYLYCNDDDPKELYEAVLPFVLGDAPFVTFHHFPYRGQQFYMYMHYLRTYLHETEWVLFLDIDEFLVMKNSNNIDKFMQKYTDTCDSVYFNWWFYGNSGFNDRPGGSVLEQYYRRAPGPHPLTKTMTRASSIDLTKINRKFLFWHRWDDDVGGHMKRVNVLLDDMSKYYDDFPHAASAFLKEDSREDKILSSAYIAHVAFKSRQDFALRLRRGAIAEFKGQDLWGQYVGDDAAADVFLGALNEVEDRYLQSFWRNIVDAGRLSAVVEPSPYPNIAIGKRATQSSISEWSVKQNLNEDAEGALDGVPTGEYSFHTNIEQDPWWRVDLIDLHEVHEIRIFNRIGMEEFNRRASLLHASSSLDGKEWTTLYVRQEATSFGGVDGFPLVIKLKEPVTARFIEIGLRQREFLHLDQVELYGEKLEAGE